MVVVCFAMIQDRGKGKYHQYETISHDLIYDNCGNELCWLSGFSSIKNGWTDRTGILHRQDQQITYHFFIFDRPKKKKNDCWRAFLRNGTRRSLRDSIRMDENLAWRNTTHTKQKYKNSNTHVIISSCVNIIQWWK